MKQVKYPCFIRLLSVFYPSFIPVLVERISIRITWDKANFTKLSERRAAVF
jgi:hypothetical protein